jgi:hypothetical protein
MQCAQSRAWPLLLWQSVDHLNVDTAKNSKGKIYINHKVVPPILTVINVREARENFSNHDTKLVILGGLKQAEGYRPYVGTSILEIFSYS